MTPLSDALLLKRLFARLRPHLRWLVPSTIFAVGTVLAQVKTVALPKDFIDEALVKREWGAVLQTCLALVGLFVVYGTCDFLHRFCLRVAVERSVRGLRNELFEKLLVLSNDRGGHTSGKAMAHIVSDVQVVSQGLHILADIIKEPLMVLGLLATLFYINWKLTMICAVALPLIGLLGKFLGRSARRNQTQIQGSLEHLSDHVLESLGGLKTAHAYGRVADLQREFDAKTSHTYRYLIRLARTEELISPLTKLLTAGVGALLMGFGGYFVVNDEMTTGGLIAFITAAATVQQPLRQINHVNVRLQQVLAAAQRLFSLLETPLDSVGQAQAEQLAHDLERRAPTVDGKRASPKAVAATRVPSLRFRDVAYKYPANAENERAWAVEGLGFHLEAGKRIALVGRSGSGKSTTCLLALRFADPQRGQILLDGKEAADWALGDYRSHFAWVSQDIFLFNRSIRANLEFARPDASESDLWKALERAHLEDFVKSLPQGLDTRLGERASQISGGEKQRIAIARAFLKNAPIVLLDEATSQLDSQSEKAVTSALRELMSDRSALIIAHRLSTVRDADEVFVLEHGHLAEQGAPAQLLERPDGLFRRLWETSRA